MIHSGLKLKFSKITPIEIPLAGTIKVSASWRESLDITLDDKILNAEFIIVDFLLFD